MDWLTTDLITLLKYLLPGLVAAWVFYGLTAHPKPSPFERVAQALIFTALVSVATSMLRELFFLIGRLFTIGHWTTDTSFAWSVVVAIVIGTAIATAANNDWPHKMLREPFCVRKLFSIPSVTRRTSFPSEWYRVFNEKARYAVLELSDGKRLFGWCEEWPNQPDSGHFVLMQAVWVGVANEVRVRPDHEHMLVAVTDVKRIEILAEDSPVIDRCLLPTNGEEVHE